MLILPNPERGLSNEGSREFADCGRLGTTLNEQLAGRLTVWLAAFYVGVAELIARFPISI